MLGGRSYKAEERCGEQKEMMMLIAPGTKRAGSSNTRNGEPQSVVAGSHSWWRIFYTVPAAEVPSPGRPTVPILVQLGHHEGSSSNSSHARGCYDPCRDRISDLNQKRRGVTLNIRGLTTDTHSKLREDPSALILGNRTMEGRSVGREGGSQEGRPSRKMWRRCLVGQECVGT